MYLRISRLRFVFVRVCLSLIILLFLLEVRIIFQGDSNSYKSSMEIAFWEHLFEQDRLLTNEQRMQHIEITEKERQKSVLNWTYIFYDIYKQKIETLQQRDSKSTFKQITVEDQESQHQSIYEIYEETPVFQRPKFCSSKLIFHAQCPYNNCRWRCDRFSINSENIRRANVFHHADIKTEDMYEKQKHRSSNDIWILWIDEANRKLEYLNEYQFNWTLSFRQDSEVSIGTYGLLIHDDVDRYIYSKNKSDSSLSSDFIAILANHSIVISDFLLEKRILTNYRYRSKHALWFVSNCEPKKRLNYYHQLKFYFPINAYGLCIDNEQTTCVKNDQCEINQNRLALFYLAFESQTCTDYITEKFWRAIHYGMIPVVFGPSKQSYLDLGIPETAFIHVEDFKSAKQLGKYLHKVANDYYLYREYFQWLNHYQLFYETNDLEPIRMCELCMRLNLQDKNEHRFYTNIHQWHRNEC